MWIGRVLLCLLCLVVPWVFIEGETRVFFSSRESVEKELLRLIAHSRVSIDMALFELRSPALAQALARARARGVATRLVLDASRGRRDLHDEPVRWLGGKRRSGRGVMHNKFALFDQLCVITGSYNWTPGAEYSNYENVLRTNDPNVVEAYRQEFESLWLQAETLSIRPSPLMPRPIIIQRKKRRPRRKRIRLKLQKPWTIGGRG